MAGCGISGRTTIAKCLSDLTVAGFIEIEKKRDGFKHSNLYRLVDSPENGRLDSPVKRTIG